MMCYKRAWQNQSGLLWYITETKKKKKHPTLSICCTFNTVSTEYRSYEHFNANDFKRNLDGVP